MVEELCEWIEIGMPSNNNNGEITGDQIGGAFSREVLFKTTNQRLYIL